MSGRRFFFRAGAAVWIAGGIGHLILIDALTLNGRTRVSEFIPHADLLDTMETTIMNFGALGSTTAFLAFAGFSLWVPLSLALLGVSYFMLAAQESIRLRPFIGVGVVVSATFCAVAAICFIYPPTIGAALATALFVASWVRNER
jgi:hypothetical protein